MNKISLSDAFCSGCQFGAPVELLKKDGDKGFLIEAYTGAVVERWWGRLAIDVSGITAKKNIPVLKNHSPDSIVGYSTKTWAEKSFFVSGKFSEVTEPAKEVKALAEEGFPWQASIGVRPLEVMQIAEGAKSKVNGFEITGPADIWTKSEVFETSFVPMGADDETGVSMLSKFDEKQETEKKQERENMELTIEKVIEEHPAIASALMAKGAAGEQERVKEVFGQAMPGHEALIESLAFDGKTSGPEAAVQVLAAEKKLRKGVADALATETPAPVTPVEPALPAGGAPIFASDDERMEHEWGNSAEIRAEFGGDKDAFLAAEKAIKAGMVKTLG